MPESITLPDDLLARFFRSEPDNGLGEYERLAWWKTCADGWRIGYTTTRMIGGKYDGKFAVVAYKPIGKGARIGKATTWALDYHRGYVRRKDARARSIALWNTHEAKGGGKPRPGAR